jgi:hypothetical protein
MTWLDIMPFSMGGGGRRPKDFPVLYVFCP